jgi:hypothetical protein
MVHEANGSSMNYPYAYLCYAQQKPQAYDEYKSQFFVLDSDCHLEAVHKQFTVIHNKLQDLKAPPQTEFKAKKEKATAVRGGRLKLYGAGSGVGDDQTDKAGKHLIARATAFIEAKELDVYINAKRKLYSAKLSDWRKAACAASELKVVCISTGLTLDLDYPEYLGLEFSLKQMMRSRNALKTLFDDAATAVADEG